MESLVYMEYAVAGIIRYWLMNSDYKQLIADRVEVSTPLNSWKKVTEGAFLYNKGIDPYCGDMFHETPIGLFIFNFMLSNCSQWLGIIFILCDLLTAHLLYRTACNFMRELFQRQSIEKVNYAKDSAALILKDADLKLSPVYVASAYLFNPYVIFNCVGQTTTVFTNLCLAAAFLSMITGRRLPCCLSLALATLQSLYPVVLIVPAAIYIARRKTDVLLGQKSSQRWSVLLTVVTFLAALGFLLCISAQLAGNWAFLHSTYGFILNVPDLRPNIGLFWYFFTEMFEHFRLLFICAFQINATLLYLVPLTLRLHTEPMLLAASLTALMAIFKSYPCLGDVGFYLALLPMWKHLFNYMQQGFIVGCFFLITSVLGPIVWHLWIYSRSANANFYFGVTLAFATAQIFLVTDILFAYIKREFSLYNGLRREINGKPAKLVLE
ncbi:phosphatidylinositol glycan anchor biosynthesis class U protein [Anabrus simplex]|uniref:phosphatidylinositol glycan anchor biosynthesis class U protein n=1 Tax=Anabrus simplex TaxID=316456 RepID=UPI0035A3BF9C